MKELKDYTYEELLKKITQDIVESLIDGGFKGMKQAIEVAVDVTLRWAKDRA